MKVALKMKRKKDGSNRHYIVADSRMMEYAEEKPAEKHWSLQNLSIPVHLQSAIEQGTQMRFLKQPQL
ncbi:hypothetical protein E2562_004538 [Oryza meyeriana var. granulata]|uniref:Uncharacterized protein n=1 Tax=Oryza meyeriana var. granulata TaxID=110450 RepID=A0A6G1F3C1_9ORYZ|nr:hypothetical protein E2562_004538 [Oryza meyeriana var. granulata]